MPLDKDGLEELQKVVTEEWEKVVEELHKAVLARVNLHPKFQDKGVKAHRPSGMRTPWHPYSGPKPSASNMSLDNKVHLISFAGSFLDVEISMLRPIYVVEMNWKFKSSKFKSIDDAEYYCFVNPLWAGWLSDWRNLPPESLVTYLFENPDRHDVDVDDPKDEKEFADKFVKLYGKASLEERIEFMAYALEKPAATSKKDFDKYKDQHLYTVERMFCSTWTEVDPTENDEEVDIV